MDDETLLEERFADYKPILLTDDRLFKQVFGSAGKEDCLKALVAPILKIYESDIEYIVINNPELPPEKDEIKFPHLDILATLKVRGREKLIDVEMQVGNLLDYTSRSTIYLVHIAEESLKRGEAYADARQVVQISFITRYTSPGERALAERLHNAQPRN